MIAEAPLLSLLLHSSGLLQSEHKREQEESKEGHSVYLPGVMK